MPDVLVLYATKHGHTGKIAAKVAQAVQAAGATAHLHDIARSQAVEPAGHDAVIVGASIHAGHYQREIVSWGKRHSQTLNEMPSAFFSVCLTAADDTDEARKATRGYIESMIADSAWTPARTVTFAGALQYREYDFATRLAMRLMMRLSHHPSDASHDYDFTDWDAVERFGRECAALATGTASSTGTSARAA